MAGTANMALALEKFKNSALKKAKVDIERHGCEEALDSLVAIYKVNRGTFLANIVTQVIERHLFRGLDKIFAPVKVNQLNDEQIMAIASEPQTSITMRASLNDKITKLEEGRNILRRAMTVSH